MDTAKTVAITHCYTDKNKGDAAIIQSTIQLLRAAEPELKIHLHSIFGPKDLRFSTEHKYIEPMAEELYPAIFYNPEKLRWLPVEASRGLVFLGVLVKSLLLLISVHPAWVRIVARGRHAEAVLALASADLVISKGGSYLSTQNRSLRQAFSLMALLYPLVFALRYRRPCVIFSQSLGPINGGFNRFLFDKVLSRLDRIYVREALCLEVYESVRDVHAKSPMKVIPDTAYFFDPPTADWTGTKAYQDTLAKFDGERLKLGLTIVDHAFPYVADDAAREAKRAAYLKAVSALIRHLRDTHDAQVHIFPQVTVNNSHLGHNDTKLSRQIADAFLDEGLQNVAFHFHNFSPTELRMLYRQMDCFVGTRLHSVIFATSTGCPAVNIAYHGTKSQGIIGGISALKDNVLLIDTINAEDLIDRVDTMIKKRDHLRNDILREVSEMQNRLLMAVKQVLGMIRD